jgi:hypothetical protein
MVFGHELEPFYVKPEHSEAMLVQSGPEDHRPAKSPHPGE